MALPYTTTMPRPHRAAGLARVWWLLLGLTLLPVVLACVSAARSGWAPESDDATVAIFSHDAFTTHPPLTGLPSTLGTGSHLRAVHHLGPLEPFVLALPYALSGGSTVGLLAGVGLVNCAAVAGSAVIA